MAVNFLKTGAASHEAAKQEEVEAQKKKEESGKMWRFFMKVGEEASLTFVDGELSPEGFLLPPRYYEHNLFLNGKWGNTFVCPQMSAPHLGEKCPICASGDRPALVSLFTVIDHRTFQSQDKTKTYKDLPRLFVAKSQTMEILAKIAVKRGGLAGCTFDVSRVGDKSPGVGTMFDFTSKSPVEELRASPQYQREFVDPTTNQKVVKSIFVPADYEKEIVFRTAAELAQLGFGAPQVSGYGGGSNYTPPTQQNGGSMDYSSQL